MADPSFLGLPLELRHIIYLYILPQRLQLVAPGCESSLKYWNKISILLVNHQLREEAIDTLKRALPTRTIVLQRPTGGGPIPVLVSSEYTGFRERIVNMVIRTPFHLDDRWSFSLSSKSPEHTRMCLFRLLRHMPALRNITCEITWDLQGSWSPSPTVLLPHLRQRMLEEFRRVTISQIELPGWDVGYQVKDLTRWKNERSGVVILTRQ